MQGYQTRAAKQWKTSMSALHEFIIHHCTCIMPPRNTSISNHKCKLQANLVKNIRHLLVFNEYQRRERNAIAIPVCARKRSKCIIENEKKKQGHFHLPLIPQSTAHLNDSPHALPDNTSQTPSYAPAPQTSPPSIHKYISNQA